jgi:hypothetical protein
MTFANRLRSSRGPRWFLPRARALQLLASGRAKNRATRVPAGTMMRQTQPHETTAAARPGHSHALGTHARVMSLRRGMPRGRQCVLKGRTTAARGGHSHALEVRGGFLQRLMLRAARRALTRQRNLCRMVVERLGLSRVLGPAHSRRALAQGPPLLAATDRSGDTIASLGIGVF